MWNNFYIENSMLKSKIFQNILKCSIFSFTNYGFLKKEIPENFKIPKNIIINVEVRMVLWYET
jgi:hypothetical protein